MPTPLEKMTQGLESIKAQVCFLSLEQSKYTRFLAKRYLSQGSHSVTLSSLSIGLAGTNKS
jgi:hypothetical protein